MFRKLFLSVLIAVGLAVGLASPAQAADSAAKLTFWNSPDSIGPINVVWENVFSGARYVDAVAVGGIEGEGYDRSCCPDDNTTSEPRSIRLGPGYCVRYVFWINGVRGSTVFQECNYGSTYRYINVHPGAGWGGPSDTWRTEARSYRAP